MNNDKFHTNSNLKPEFEVPNDQCQSLDWSHEINRYPPADSSAAPSVPLESSNIYSAPTIGSHSNYSSEGYFPQNNQPAGYPVRLGQRYHATESSTTAPVPLESSQIFSAPALPPHSNYSSEGYFPPQNNSQGYPVRLGQSVSSSGMPQHRNTSLPMPIQHTRDVYATNTPGFRRSEHLNQNSRSPNVYTTRRPSQISTPAIPPRGYSGGSVTMNAPSYNNNIPRPSPNIPPLGEMLAFGTLQYNDAHNTPVTPVIYGSIDKGFFLSEEEWTCYRRNYFSCVCSFSLDPYYPTLPITFQANNSQSAFTVLGFAMTISALVSETDNHKIDLVQHTPKRDKGPTTTPAKVRLSPKVLPGIGGSQGTMGMFGSSDMSTTGMSGRSGAYDTGYAQPQHSGGPPIEHAFERIQFKQATANNGKRRAAQQYYHLVVELWADVGSPDHPHWLQVAQRKSAKMIVRGRSPGHYQSERRSSANGGSGALPAPLPGYNPAMMRTYVLG